MNSSSIALDMFMEMDTKETQEDKIDKRCPVRHFYIDFKGILL